MSVGNICKIISLFKMSFIIKTRETALAYQNYKYPCFVNFSIKYEYSSNKLKFYSSFSLVSSRLIENVNAVERSYTFISYIRKSACNVTTIKTYQLNEF